MRKLYAPTKAKAQEYADRAHAYLLENNAAYAADVAAGNTVRWAEPMQDRVGATLSNPGTPSGDWWIVVDARCEGAFKGDGK